MTDARELIERFNDAWVRGDLAAVADCLADDVTYTPNAWDGPARSIHGREAVAEAFAEQLGPGEGPILGVVWATGDRAVCEWQWAPGADGSVLRGMDVYRIHDGRIVAKDVYGKITANSKAEYFDQWYADMLASPGRDVIIGRAMGLPAELRDSGVLPWEGIDEVTDELRLPPGGLLLDIACGRGGYGIEVARRADARLIGVDFSAVALERARATSAERLPGGRSEFRIGTLVATGLPTGVADGLMCVDAVQFAEPPVAAMLEFRRVLRAGGRLVPSCWEAVDPADERVPARIRAVDLRRDLLAAGFVDVEVHQKPAWRQAERTLWEDAVAAEPSDPAIESLQAEARSSLATFDSLRRVFATATAP